MLSELRQFYTPQNIELAVTPLVLLMVWLFSLLTSIGRYLSWSSVLYWLFYVRNRERWVHGKLQRPWPDRKQIENEIRWSLRSCVVFSFITLGVYYCAIRGWTAIYLNVSDHGWGYLVGSIFIMLLLHDTYFYFTHLLSHRITWVFRKFHRIHHQSANPTVFADIMFHPVDAAVHAGFAPLFLFFLPVHPLAFGLFIFLVTVVNAIGHIGYEIFPASMARTPVLKWISRATLHNIHHSHIHYNFGLYFRVWDCIFQTEKLPTNSAAANTQPDRSVG